MSDFEKIQGSILQSYMDYPPKIVEVTERGIALLERMTKSLRMSHVVLHRHEKIGKMLKRI